MTFSLPSRSSLLKGSFLNPDDDGDGDGDGDGSEGPYPTLEKKTKIDVVCFCSP